MSPLLVLLIQMALTLVVVSLIARWFVAPRLASLPVEDALAPLVLVHTFRYVLIAVFVPPVNEAMLPAGATKLMAYGDLTTALLALLAVMALRFRWPGRIMLTWTFSVVGAADIIHALVRILGSQLYIYNLGTLWFVITFFAPILVVTHAMIFTRLIRGRAAGSSTTVT